MSQHKYAIFPAIGIARVGTSDEYYLAPETPNALPTNPDGCPFTAKDLRDEQKRLKRQAARFTVHTVNADGTTTPVTIGEDEIKTIRWTVHLANKKPIWYDFSTNQGEDGYASNHSLRNAAITGADRIAMITDPGARSVQEPGECRHFDRATTQDADQRFPPQDIGPFSIDTLGDINMTEQGELHVVAGHGHSGSDLKHRTIKTYANNDGWYDDTSDGPVTAVVVLHDGTEIETTPAWVICGPPAYAPQIANLVTLYDTIFDTTVRKMNARPNIYSQGMWNSGDNGFKPHFETHIKPILERGQHYPWVVAIPPRPHCFNMEMMADNSSGMKGMRQRIVDYLRAPGDENTLVSGTTGGTMMPYLAGDASIGPADKTPSKFLCLTDTQYFMLQQWADGYFTSGPDCAPTQSEGDAITQGVLENCVGGAFSPGIEMTWVSRLTQIYDAPFRIHVKEDVSYPLSLGWQPEAGLEPGDVTKFMAIPWQADFNECSAQPVDGRTVWWWPAQRPLFVYRKQKEDVQPKASILDMVEAGDIKQVPWVGTDYNMNSSNFVSFASDNEMVEKWMDMGFIINEGDDKTPLFVEVERTLEMPKE